MPAPVVLGDSGMHHGWNKDVGNGAGGGSGERLGPHADDLVQAVGHAKGASNHFRILTEAARPIIVREDGVGMRAWFEIVAFSEQPSQSGLKSERREHPARNILDVRLFDL